MLRLPQSSFQDSQSYATMRSADKFGDPFLIPSLAMTPSEPRTVFDFCKFLYGQHPEWAQAGRIITSYFITDVDFIGEDAGDTSEQEELREWLHDGVQAFDHQRDIADDVWCTGNGFGRFYTPFDRYLVIPTESGYLEMAVSRFPEAKYDFASMTYEVDNPVTAHKESKYRSKLSASFFDRASRDVNRIRLTRIDPSYVWLQHSFMSGRTQVVERFDPMVIASIKRGDLHQVNDMPQAQLSAISKDMDFLYNEGEIFHMKHPTISGISNGGWGVPHILLNFANLYQLSVYRRVDQAVGLDYVLPTRIIAPALQAQTTDAFASTGSMQVWQAAISHMIREKQANPFRTFTLPMPVSYQEIGANRTLAPHENLMFHQDAMLSSCGLPPEMFKGSMGFQASPVALRIFENQWKFYGSGFSRHLRWVTNQRQDMLGRERMKTAAKPPRTLDDIESRHIMLQLAAGGEFPRGPALQSIGVRDAVGAMVARKREDIEADRRIRKLEEEAAAEANGSLSGPGGAPGGAVVTPADKAEQAVQEAKRLLQIPFDGDRAKELAAIRSSDQDFHALVKQKMEEFRASARSAGGQQVAQIASAA